MRVKALKLAKKGKINVNSSTVNSLFKDREER